jgi:phosphate transport system substrate-binding protein
MMKKFFYVFMFLAISMVGSKLASAADPIKADGSSTVFPITEAVAEEFGKTGGGRVIVGISGTGGGFKRFCRGETDISNASRPIKQKEIDACREGGVQYVELPVAYDGLAVVVNPRNTWVDYLTVEELKKIWEPGAQAVITKWNQVRSDFPDEDLQLFGPGTDSGTFDYFTEVINGKSGSSRGDYTASEDDNVLVEGVSSSKGGLGYFGLAYYEENADKLRVVPVKSKGEPVAPAKETVLNGSYEPLSRPIFIYLNKDSLKAKEAVRKFAEYYLQNAAVLSEEVGYVPLSPEEYETGLGKL